MGRKLCEHEPKQETGGRLQGETLTERFGERSATQDDFARADEKLQWLFTNMSEGFALHRIVLDDQGRPCDYVFLEMNAAFERLTGLSAGEAIGKRVTQVLRGIEKDPSDWIGTYGRVALTGAPLQFESCAVPLGKWFAVSAFCPRQGYFAVILSDITHRKNAEAQRRVAEERLLVALRSIGDAVISTDTDGRVIMLNRVAEMLTGFAQGEAVGRSLREIFPIVNEDTGEPVEDAVREVIENDAEVALANHTALVRRDGTRISIVYRAAPVCSENGDRLGGVLVLRDVTEERRAERALAENEAKYRHLRKIARLYEVMSRVNESIVRTHDERDLFAQVCRILAELGGFPLAWIGLVEGRDITPVASAGPAAGYLHTIRVQVDGELGQGPTGTAVREARSVINHDFDVNPLTAAWRSLALTQGFRASAAFPLRRHGKPIGTLTLYAARPSSFDAQHVKLIESLCADISYALDALDHERLRTDAEEALKRSENQLRVLVENLSVGVAFIDETGRFSHTNRQFLKLFGLAPDADILNVNSQDWSAWQVFDETGGILHVDEHPVRKAVLSRCAVRNQQVGVRVPGGQNITWMVVSAEPLFDAGGRMEGVICTYNDITERRRVEEALRSSEMRYRTLHESLRDGFVLVKMDGQIAECNDVYCQMLGYSAEELRKLTYQDLTPERWHAEESRIVREQIIARGYSDVYEKEYRRKDGTIFPIELRTILWRDEAGHPIGMWGIVRDISERKQAEEALREVDRRKNEFLAVLSHELRNPLAPITNSLYVLDHAPHEGEQASRAKQVIARQVAHLSSLVNDLLDVTRISRNKIHLSKEPLELNELARRVVEDNRSLFEKDEVSLELEPASRPIHVLADRTRVVQVIGNLLQNAAKFTHKGGYTRVSLSVEGALAVVSVLDDGVGMAPETLSRLFQPFMQVDQTLDRSQGGLGLGLALVKGLVELHGGSVVACSEGVGKGTEFVVRLPLHTGAALEPESSTQVRERVRRRVLIIEDNHDAADSLREVLLLGEHEVEIAHNGFDGVAKAGVFKPDLVLCDIGLPAMDGYEVARAFRSDDKLKHTHLVALSGYALAEDLQRAVEAGFDRHLPKPPAIEKLEELLEGIPGAEEI